MTLEQLRIFVAVADLQHVTRAAQALNLAQSAASTAISALEARHRTKLFHRVGRGIELTEGGRIFLLEARAVLARVAAAERTLADLSDLESGTVMIQASQTIANYWLPRHLVAFRRAYPKIGIRLVIGNTAQVAAAVHEGLAELGFVEGAIEDEALSSTTIAYDRMLLVVGADHPWAARMQVTPEQLLQSDWVLRERGSGTRSVFESELARFGIGPNALSVTLELPSNEAVRAAVEAGMGATVLSASVAAPGLEAGLLHCIKLDLVDRSFHVLRHRERYQSRAADALLSLIEHGGARSLAA